MKRIFFTCFLIAASLQSIPSSFAATPVCQSLNTPVTVASSFTVTMKSMVVSEKIGSKQVSINYNLKNDTPDKQLDEGTFTLFLTDGSMVIQYGFFGTTFPGDQITRSYTWEFLKPKEVLAIGFNTSVFNMGYNSNKLNWVLPGAPCSLKESAPEVDWTNKARYSSQLDWKLCVSSAVITGEKENCGSEPDASSNAPSPAEAAKQAIAAANEAIDAVNNSNDSANKALEAADAATIAAQDAAQSAELAGAVSVAAAEAAGEIAQEALDATNMATDFALSAAEAADAATAFAIDTKESADVVINRAVELFNQLKKITDTLIEITKRISAQLALKVK